MGARVSGLRASQASRMLRSTGHSTSGKGDITCGHRASCRRNRWIPHRHTRDERRRTLGDDAVATSTAGLTTPARRWWPTSSAVWLQHSQVFWCKALHDVVVQSRQSSQLAASEANQRAVVQDILHKHGHAQTAFLGIMNEFWQTNAIFTAFTALALGGIVTNWRQFADATTRNRCS